MCESECRQQVQQLLTKANLPIQSASSLLSAAAAVSASTAPALSLSSPCALAAPVSRKCPSSVDVSGHGSDSSTAIRISPPAPPLALPPTPLRQNTMLSRSVGLVRASAELLSFPFPSRLRAMGDASGNGCVGEQPASEPLWLWLSPASSSAGMLPQVLLIVSDVSIGTSDMLGCR